MGKETDICPFCLGIPSDPRCLPCLHVLCDNCLGKFAEHERTDDPFHDATYHRVLSIKCPVCRRQFQTTKEKIARFPSAIRCRSCSKFVKSIREFPCGHKNDKVCFECIEKKGNGTSLICPRCKLSSNATLAELPQMFLCSDCKRFSKDQNCVNCSRSWLQLELDQILERERTEAGMRHRILFRAERLAERARRNVERSERSNVESRETNRSPATLLCYMITIFLILACIGALLPYLEEESKERYKEYPAGKTSVYKREPVYIKDCYDMVNAHGEVYDRKCEWLFSGYRTVKVKRTPED